MAKTHPCIFQKSSRKREEKYLRIQLEQQKKAYEEMKKQMEKLQSAQSDAPGEGRIAAGESGYADLNRKSGSPDPKPDSKPASPDSDPSEDYSPVTAAKPLMGRPTDDRVAYADMSADGGLLSPVTMESTLGGSEQQLGEEEDGADSRKQSHNPAPYLVSCCVCMCHQCGVWCVGVVM